MSLGSSSIARGGSFDNNPGQSYITCHQGETPDVCRVIDTISYCLERSRSMLDTKDTGDEIARRQDALRTLLDAALPREVLPEPGESALHYGHFLAYVAMGLHRGLYPLADARQIDRRW